jgi:hypothetical protein
MVKSVQRTANHPELVRIVARLDADDPELGRYANGLVGERVSLPLAWNELADGQKYDILMMCADDLRFRTTGWDDEVVRAFEQWPDRIGLVYTDDGIHGRNLATHSFVSRQWIEAVGFYLPKQLTGDFVDNWLHRLAASIGRVTYLPRVYIEHLHPIVGKAQMDDTYAYRLTGEGPRMAQDAWKGLVGSGAPEKALRRLRGAISES